MEREMAPADADRRRIVKSKQGRVVSNKMDKSIIVRVDTLRQHRLYKKRVRHSKRFLAHDEGNEAQVGDYVRIVESRPYSKLKSWRLDYIVRRHGAAVLADTIGGKEEAAALEAVSSTESGEE